MDPATGREFSWPNPQDDPELYPKPPPGFQYDTEGRLVGIPKPRPKAGRPIAVPMEPLEIIYGTNEIVVKEPKEPTVRATAI